jgi:O-antigen/teichoic acid export membrane protein
MGIVARQSIKGSIVSYFGVFIGFITSMLVVVPLVDPASYGLLGILCDAATLLGSLAMVGMSASGVKYFPYFKNPAKYHNGFFYYLLVIPLLGVAVFFSLAVILKAPIISYFSQNAAVFADYFFWIFPWAFFIVYQNIFATYSNVLMRIVIPRTVQEVIIRIFNMAILLMFAFDIIDIHWLVALQVMVYGVAMLINFLYIARIDKLSLHHDNSFIPIPMRKEIASYAGYTLLASVGTTIMQRVDSFMIAGMLGLESLGIYRIAMYMGIISEIPSRSLFAIAQPVAAEAIKNNDTEALSKLLKQVSINLMLISSAIFLLLYVNVDNIFELVPNGQRYESGKWVMVFIALAGVINITFTFSLNILQLSKHYMYYLPFLLLLSLCGILGNKLLIPYLDINGAALAKVITYCVFGLLLTTFVYCKLRIHPLTWNHLKLLLLVLLAIGLHHLLPELPVPFFDALYRTVLIAVLGIVLVYKLKISEDANKIADKILKKSN